MSTATGDPTPPEENLGDAEPEGAEERPDIFPTEYRSAEDAADVAEFAVAERAVARHAGTPAEVAGVAEAGKARRAEDRIEGWRRRHPR